MSKGLSSGKPKDLGIVMYQKIKTKLSCFYIFSNLSNLEIKELMLNELNV